MTSDLELLHADRFPGARVKQGYVITFKPVYLWISVFCMLILSYVVVLYTLDMVGWPGYSLRESSAISMN